MYCLYLLSYSQGQHVVIEIACKLPHIVLISHARKVMLKILQTRLKQYMNCELLDVQAGFIKSRGTRDQIANILWINKQESSRKTSISALLTIPKPLTVWITINCGKCLQEMGIPDHLTCLWRNLYAVQEATVRTGHGTRLVPNRKRSASGLYIVTLLF